MAQVRKVYQHFPGRSGADSMREIGHVEFMPDGEIRIALDAYPAAAADSRLVVLPVNPHAPAMAPSQYRGSDKA